MKLNGDSLRFWIPILALFAFAAYSTQKLVRAHIDPEVSAPKYEFTRPLPASRGSIYSAYGKSYPFVKSVPYWEYRLDPVAMTNAVVRRRGEPPRPMKAIVRTIAEALKLNYSTVLDKVVNPPKSAPRSQFLKISSDADAHAIIADSTLVRGVAINDHHVREYIHGRRLSHVLGSVNADNVGSAGIEQRFNRELTGTPGTIQGMKDARGSELYDKRKVSIPPVPGADIFLTIDHNVQFEAEDALKWGIAEYGAAEGWCIVMDAKTGAVLAMASMPDFDPPSYGRVSEQAKVNRACAYTYEPGSVMKVITVASAIDVGFTGPDRIYNTDRFDKRYYKLPGDAGHVWDPTMTVRDAIVHSSNIVIGKLGFDFGPARLYAGMRRFGFGVKTGIELPGEEVGILFNPAKRPWDKATWSRAAIGQAFTVTAIQLCSAYQAIANDGLRMKPYIVDRIVAADGRVIRKNEPTPAGRAISAATAKTMRNVMLGVASPSGTARRAAIRGYSVAGKTGTAQKHLPGKKGYAPGLFRATFCGMTPVSDPRIVVLVTLDFSARTKYHQGGNSSGPIFRRIASTVLRYLRVPPDRPEELEEFQSDDEYDRIMTERAARSVRSGIENQQ